MTQSTKGGNTMTPEEKAAANLGIPVRGTPFFIPATHKDVIQVRERWGSTHTIEAIKGTKCELWRLKKGESTVWGDGETFHFILTKKDAPTQSKTL